MHKEKKKISKAARCFGPKVTLLVFALHLSY